MYIYVYNNMHDYILLSGQELENKHLLHFMISANPAKAKRRGKLDIP